MERQYTLESEIVSVVEGFETCTTDKTAFKHKEHLTVAVVYLQQLSVPDAVVRMRDALLAFLDHHGVPREKYSESVTVYWMDLVALRLADLDEDATLVDKCNYILSASLR
jgi:hypothetical protein